MAQRNDILEQLKSDVIDYIKTSRDFKTDVNEVKRGTYHYESIQNRPFIGITLIGDTIDEDGDVFNEVAVLGSGKTQQRVLNILLYGFVDFDGHNVEPLHDLVEDVEGFLEQNFTYKDDTYIGDILITEGEIHDEIQHQYFEMLLTIHYEKIHS